MRYGRIGNQKLSWDYPDFSIIKIDQNAEKNPKDLKRLTVTQTPVKDHQLTLGRKKIAWSNMIIKEIEISAWKVLNALMVEQV